MKTTQKLNEENLDKFELQENFTNHADMLEQKGFQLLENLAEIYGKDFTDQQLPKAASDEELNGGLKGDSEKENCFPGVKYNLPTMIYVAEIILTGAKNHAYIDFLSRLKTHAEKIGQPLEDKDGLPTKDQMESLAAKYDKIFKEEPKRIKFQKPLLPNTKITEYHIQ